MWAKQKGFTIVELLIVIIVIAILAVITIAVFNNVQARARDNIRYADAKTILKAMQLYRADNGVYPPTSATPNNTTICAGTGVGYSYSFATDGTWMKPLVDGGYLAKIPVGPDNGCSHFYRYIHPAANTYGCSFTSGYGVLMVYGMENTFVPAEASTSAPAGCAGGTLPSIFYTSDTNHWVFLVFDNG